MITEHIILKNLIKNDRYTKHVLPHVKEEYFAKESDKILFRIVKNFIITYNKLPTIDSLEIEVDDLKNVHEDSIIEILDTLKTLKTLKEDDDFDWLKDKTETFCRDRALYNAIMKSISVIQDEKKSKLSKGAIPELLTQALSVSFDSNIGHDFLEQSNTRFEYYHEKAEKIPFDLDYFNRITRNGLSKRTLTVCMAGPNVGKSLWMTHTAAHFLSIGKNVLYITMEMREEEIAKRIDCNMLDLTFDDLDVLSKDMYTKRIERLKNKTKGKLIIKEYANGTASYFHFKSLINELKIKKNFVVDAVFIDYMNICASARMNLVNTPKHLYVQSISEEFRALSQECNIPIITATQVNREGFRSSDVGMENISESFAVTGTADFIFYLQTSEELEKLGQLMVSQLKNRLNSKAKIRKFVIGVDYDKMKLFDVENTAQEEIDDSTKAPIKSIVFRGKNKSKVDKDKFKALKVD